MEPEARYTAIGAAILVLLAALAAAAVWLSRSGAREIERYTVYFERASLEGLQVGSSVDMRGVPVGRVEGLAIQPDNINRVRVTLLIYGKTPVSENTLAAVERKLVSGVARVTLDTPSPPGPALTRAPHGEDYPVIAEGQSNLEQFSDAFNRLVITGSGTLAAVNALLSEPNRKQIMAAIADLHAMSARVARAADELSASGRRIASTVEKLGDDADAVAAQGKLTLRDLSRAAESLERASSVGTNELRATAQELRARAETAARALESLDDPRALVFGPSPEQLGPGERLP